MRTNRWKLALAALIAFLCGFFSTFRFASAQERFDLKVRNDFFAGFAGNGAALARGMEACEAVLAKNPKDAQALVWHGGGLLFQAGEAFQRGDQNKGTDLWTRGLKEMNTAVELEPDSVGVRIPRGAVLLATSRFVPAEMAKPLIADGVSDYQRAYDIQKPRLDTLGTHPRGELLFGLADGYSRLGDATMARKYFEEIRRDLPDTEYAKRANLWMKNGSLPVEKTSCVGCHVAK